MEGGRSEEKVGGEVLFSVVSKLFEAKRVELFLKCTKRDRGKREASRRLFIAFFFFFSLTASGSLSFFRAIFTWQLSSDALA